MTVLEPYGPVRGEVAFFVGCMYTMRLPETALDAIEVLRRNGIRVVIPAEQVCCGSPLIRTGQTEDLARLQADQPRGLRPVPGRDDHVRRLRVDPEERLRGPARSA